MRGLRGNRPRDDKGRYIITPDAMARFEDKIDFIPFSSCYWWSGPKSTGGYGSFTLNAKEIRAHRAAWTLYKGHIPDGLFVCHTCDNPACVRIEHLFLGSQSDNMLDMWNKGRRKRLNHLTDHEKEAKRQRTLEKRRRWYQQNKTRLCARAQARRDADPDYKQKRRNWRAANKAKYAETKKSWRQKRKAQGLTVS